VAEEISNSELLLFVLQRSGGDSGQVELEELFEQCWRLFPSRFGWKAKAYPSDKAGDQALRDATKSNKLKELLRLSADRASVRLTAEGVVWVRERAEAFERLGGAGAPSQSRPSQRHLIELERSPIAQSLLAGEDLSASRAQVADLLRLTPDADSRTFRDRLESWRSDAEVAQRRAALDVLNRLEAAHPDWFGVAAR
jgi:hypothetical protein